MIADYYRLARALKFNRLRWRGGAVLDPPPKPFLLSGSAAGRTGRLQSGKNYASRTDLTAMPNRHQDSADWDSW